MITNHLFLSFFKSGSQDKHKDAKSDYSPEELPIHDLGSDPIAGFDFRILKYLSSCQNYDK